MITEEQGFFKKNAPLIVTLLVCICAVSTIYSNTLNAEFILDDKLAISNNHAVRMDSITLDSISTSMKGNRPIPMLSFAINYYFHGYNVQGYHVVNILIHIINTVLMFFLCSKLLIIAGYKEGWERSWIPVITACIWAVNPVHVQSVTYIVQRMTSMATMFYIASFLCYLIARTAPGKKTKNIVAVLSVVAGLFAVLSKEIAVTLPFFILLYEWLFFRDADTRLLKKYIWLIVFLVIVIPLAGFFFVQHSYSDFITSEYSKHNFNMVQRCLTQPRVVIYYIGLMLFPHPSRLNLVYDFDVSNSIIDPFATLIAICVVIALIAGSFYLIFTRQKNKHPRNKLIAFSILWYFGNLFIESSFIPLHMVFEHRTYLPSILLFLMMLLLVVQVIKNKVVLVVITLICMVFCSYWTLNRNNDWRTNESLWLDNSLKSPDIELPYFELGAVYQRNKKDWETAYKYYMKAIDKNPSYYKTYFNIGLYYFKHGDYEAALGYFNKSFELEPENIETNTALGGLLVILKKYKRAFELLGRVLEKKPDHLLANVYMAEFYVQQNEFDQALKHYTFVLEKDPENAKNYYNNGMVFEKMGKTDLAIDYLNKSIAKEGDLAEPHILLGKIYTDAGDYDKAINHFERAVTINTASVDGHQYWAFLLLKTGDTKGAVHHFKRILEIDPENMSAFRNIGSTLFNDGDIFGSLINLNKALRLEPDNEATRKYYTMVNNTWQKMSVQERIPNVYKYLGKNKKERFAVAELGKLYYANGNYLKSIENWQEILVFEPDNVMAMSNIAVCYMSAEMYNDAVKLYNKMIQIQPDNHIVLYNLACAYSASGKLGNAVTALRNAIEKGLTDIEDIKKDPDLSKLMESDIGRKFLREFAAKS